MKYTESGLDVFESSNPPERPDDANEEHSEELRELYLGVVDDREVDEDGE